MTPSRRSLRAFRTLSSFDMTEAMRPMMNEKKNPLPIIVVIDQTWVRERTDIGVWLSQGKTGMNSSARCHSCVPITPSLRW